MSTFKTIQTLKTLEFRGSNIGVTLAIARLDGNPKPYYFSTDDLTVITEGLRARNVNIPSSYAIDDRRIPNRALMA